MTTEEHIKRLRATAQKLAQNVPLAIAAQSVHAMRVKRIFDDGVGGSYNSTREVWMDNTQLRRTNRGKTGKAEKTSWFKSYKDLKVAQGFDGNKVNLRLTNDLQSDFANAPITSGTALNVGKVIKVTDNIYIEGLRRPHNVKKLKANIRRFGDFTRFTDAERQAFKNVLQFEFNKLLKQAND
jgi:hypothetical protein